MCSTISRSAPGTINGPGSASRLLIAVIVGAACAAFAPSAAAQTDSPTPPALRPELPGKTSPSASLWIVLSITTALGLAALWRFALRSDRASTGRARPLGTPPHNSPPNSRDVSPLTLPIWLGWAGAVWIAGPVAGTIAWSLSFAAAEASGIPAPSTTDPPPLSTMGAIAIAVTLVGGLAAAGAWVFVRRLAPHAGFAGRWSDPLVGLGWLAALTPAIMLLGLLADRAHVWITRAPLPDDGLAHHTLRRIVEHAHDPWAWALIAGAVVGAPIVEEVVYRGLLQSAWLRATGRVGLSVCITAALFAAAHLVGSAPVPWYAVVRIALLGLACGIAFERTRRLAVPIVIHAAFNAANIALALALAGDPALDPNTTPSPSPTPTPTTTEQPP